MSELPEDNRIPDVTRRHGRRRQRSTTNWNAIIAITVVAAIAGAFSSAQPTGVAFFDIIERAAFAAVVTLFTACSRRWAWLILAGTATVFAATIAGHVLGAVALGFAVHAAWKTSSRDRLTGALIGALSVQALLRTDDIGFFGLTALITAAAVGCVVISGYPTIRRRNRRRILIGVGVTTGFIVIATAAFGFAAYKASEPLEFGITSARRGLDVAKQANQEGAAGYWTAAHNSFANADTSLSSPLARLVAPIPIVSQHARLARVAAGSGDNITATAARAAMVAPYHRLRASDGTFDLAKITSMEDPIRQTSEAMSNARDDVDNATTPWLVGPFRDRVNDYRRQLVRAIPRADDALAAIRVAPEILGGNGPRKYLLLFANPAESRGLGGFIGAWAQLDAINGHLELTRHGKMGALNDATDPATRKITGEPEFMRRYGHLQPARFIQNISASPDFPTVARVAEQLYPQAGGTPVDGVIYLDPTALAALLRLSGPVMAEGVPMPLTAENAADFLMHDQYVDVPDVEERSDLLSNAAEATFDALTGRELPGLSTVTSTLAPMMHGRHVMAVVNAPDANRYLESIGITGAFAKPDGHDLTSVRVSNGSANKLDYFLGNWTINSVRYSETNGLTTTSSTTVLTNVAPTSGGPDYVFGNQDTRAGRTNGRPFGSITLQVSMYSALRPTTMTINGMPVGMQVQRELGSWVATQTVTIPAQATTKITLTTSGYLPAGKPYRTTIIRQPTALKSYFRLSVTATDHRGNLISTPTQERVVTSRDPAEFVYTAKPFEKIK